MRHVRAGRHYLCDVSAGFSSAHAINEATAAGRKTINKILLWDVHHTGSMTWDRGCGNQDSVYMLAEKKARVRHDS